MEGFGVWERERGYVNLLERWLWNGVGMQVLRFRYRESGYLTTTSISGEAICDGGHLNPSSLRRRRNIVVGCHLGPRAGI